MLQQNGLEPWLAETHIGEGDHINQSVISGLNTATCFILFLSENSLKSKWSSKEFQYAHHRKIKVLIIADCTSKIILHLVQNKLEKKSLPLGTAEIFRYIFSKTRNIDKVVYPEDIQEKFQSINNYPNLFPYSELVNLIKRQIPK
jgi:hypothetical protein